jgi:antitoxin MazE
MQVAKWGNSLAVRLPKEIVDILRLKEGDDIEIILADEAKFGVKKKPLPREILARLRKYRGYMPEGFKFDREETHERGWQLDEPQARPSKKRTA